jgi:hypothetical protein
MGWEGGTGIVPSDATAVYRAEACRGNFLAFVPANELDVQNIFFS